MPDSIKNRLGLPMLLLTREQIMDLIGSIQYIENRLGERKPGQGKAASKNTRAPAMAEKESQADDGHVVPDYDAHIGRIIDTNA